MPRKAEKLTKRSLDALRPKAGGRLGWIVMRSKPASPAVQRGELEVDHEAIAALSLWLARKGAAAAIEAARQVVEARAPREI